MGPRMDARPTRRSFLAAVLSGAAALIAGALAVPSLITALSPMRRKGGAAPEVVVASEDELATLIPKRVEVRAAETDAWERHDEVPLGAAWLVKGRDHQVRAFSASCPHASCLVDFDGKDFACPCHASRFSVDGERLSGPAPRGLDPLEVRVENGKVALCFRRFRPGTPEREEL